MSDVLKVGQFCTPASSANKLPSIETLLLVYYFFHSCGNSTLVLHVEEGQSFPK